MSELISGKEALIAVAEGKEVEINNSVHGWIAVARCTMTLNSFLIGMHEFRLKPRTITLNGFEVPAPFEPKGDCIVFILDDSKTGSYRAYNYEHDGDNINSFISMWESEKEIKQVVAALRSIFNAN